MHWRWIPTLVLLAACAGDAPAPRTDAAVDAADGVRLDTLAGFQLGAPRDAVLAHAQGRGHRLECTADEGAEFCEPAGLAVEQPGHYRISFEDGALVSVATMIAPEWRNVPLDSLRRRSVALFGRPAHEDPSEGTYYALWAATDSTVVRELLCMDLVRAGSCSLTVQRVVPEELRAHLSEGPP